MLFSQKGKRKERKKNREQASAKNFCFKNNDEKSKRVFNNNNNNNNQQQQQQQEQKKTENFSSEFFIINSSLARKKERKMHFQVVNCPSQVLTLRILLLTERERERDLSFFLSLNSFFVLLSFSSSAFCCFRRVSSLHICLCERIESRKRNWKWCRSRSRTFSL